jgi:hypothetical protein
MALPSRNESNDEAVAGRFEDGWPRYATVAWILFLLLGALFLFAPIADLAADASVGVLSDRLLPDLWQLRLCHLGPRPRSRRRTAHPAAGANPHVLRKADARAVEGSRWRVSALRCIEVGMWHPTLSPTSRSRRCPNAGGRLGGAWVEDNPGSYSYNAPTVKIVEAEARFTPSAGG